MKRVAVIGSNCFTGSHFVAALLDIPDVEVLAISRSQQPHPVFLPYDTDHSRFEFHRIDIVEEFDRLAELLDVEKPDRIINVAALSEVALSIERPVEYYAINTLAVVRLSDTLTRRDWLERYVHISSAEIYGSCPNAVVGTGRFDRRRGRFETPTLPRRPPRISILRQSLEPMACQLRSCVQPTSTDATNNSLRLFRVP